jgi:hypothetical protein
MQNFAKGQSHRVVGKFVNSMLAGLIPMIEGAKIRGHAFRCKDMLSTALPLFPASFKSSSCGARLAADRRWRAA